MVGDAKIPTKNYIILYVYIYLPAIITGDIHTQRLDGKRARAGWMVCFLGDYLILGVLQMLAMVCDTFESIGHGT